MIEEAATSLYYSRAELDSCSNKGRLYEDNWTRDTYSLSLTSLVERLDSMRSNPMQRW